MLDHYQRDKTSPGENSVPSFRAPIVLHLQSFPRTQVRVSNLLSSWLPLCLQFSILRFQLLTTDSCV